MKPIKVILIDDEKDMCNDLKEVIEEYRDDIHVSVSYHPLDAIAKLKKNDYHVLVTDIRMPEMDGIQLIEKAHQMNGDIQHIVITGHGDLDYAIKAMHMGASNFFKKPLDIKLLTTGIDKAFEKYMLHQTIHERDMIFNALTHAAQDAIIMTDNKNQIRFWNNFAEQLFGFSSKETIQKTLYQLIISQNNQQKFKQWISAQQNVNKKRSLETFETQAIKKNGKRITIELTCTPVLIQNEYTDIFILRDMTRHKKQMIQLKKMKAHADQMAEKADHANQAKSDFLRTMSHEIRTPINSVISLTYLLTNTSLDEEQKKYVISIQTSAESLLFIVNDIIELEKIETGQLTLNPVHYHFKSSIQEIIGIFDHSFQSKELELKLTIDKKIPDHVYADKGRLRQILINLIGNAIKFTERGHISLCIQLESQKKNSIVLHFSIQDTGIGISKKQIKRLFKTFSQANPTIASKYGGSGLGLSISKRICEMMNGSIGVESEEGKGSTFWFTVQIQHSQEKDLKEEPDENLKINKKLKGLSILLVEDNLVNQIYAKNILTKSGGKVTVVENGKKAIEILAKQKFDIIFMDIQMPVMDGYHAAKIIRDPTSNVLDHDVPIIAMSAHSKSDHQKKCMDFGMNGYITKPINIKHLNQFYFS